MFTPHCKQGYINPELSAFCATHSAATKQDLLYSNTPSTTVTMVLEDSEDSVFEIDITVSSDLILLIFCYCCTAYCVRTVDTKDVACFI